MPAPMDDVGDGADDGVELLSPTLYLLAGDGTEEGSEDTEPGATTAPALAAVSKTGGALPLDATTTGAREWDDVCGRSAP